MWYLGDTFYAASCCYEISWNCIVLIWTFHLIMHTHIVFTILLIMLWHGQKILNAIRYSYITILKLLELPLVWNGFVFRFTSFANRIARGSRKKISPLWLTFWMLTRFIHTIHTIYGYISMHQESTEFSGQYLMEWEIPDTDCRLNSIDVMRFMVAS